MVCWFLSLSAPIVIILVQISLFFYRMRLFNKGMLKESELALNSRNKKKLLSCVYCFVTLMCLGNFSVFRITELCLQCLVISVIDPLPLTFITDPKMLRFTTWTVSPLETNHHVRHAAQCSKNTAMTVATSFPSSHYVSVCSSSFSKLR